MNFFYIRKNINYFPKEFILKILSFTMVEFQMIMAIQYIITVILVFGISYKNIVNKMG